MSHFSSLIYFLSNRYEGDDEDEEDLDGRSENSELEADSTVDEGTIHHFVYCLPIGGRHNAWTRDIQKRQKLKCTICGSHDKGTLRIPLQCSAGTDNEYKEFRKFHSDYCTQVRVKVENLF